MKSVIVLSGSTRQNVEAMPGRDDCSLICLTIPKKMVPKSTYIIDSETGDITECSIVERPNLKHTYKPKCPMVSNREFLKLGYP